MGSISTWVILALLFGFVLLICCSPLVRARNISIRNYINGRRSRNKSPFISKWFKTFKTKQLARQLLLFPVQAFYTVMIISLSILILVFSLIIQNESDGIWEHDATYYLSSQETYGFKTIDNIPVLLTRGSAFTEKDARKLARLPGVNYLEKTPFMMDVVPLISLDQLTTSVNSWILKNDTALSYKDKWIIPNVDYQMINEKDFNRMFPNKNYTDFKGKVMLFIPNDDHLSKDARLEKAYINKDLHFIRLINANGKSKKIEKAFTVYDAQNQSMIKPIGNADNIHYNNFTIVFDEDTFVHCYSMDITILRCIWTMA